MAGKCPMCGAPMRSQSCAYCGYIEAPERAPAVLHQPQTQQSVQPQVIIIHQNAPASKPTPAPRAMPTVSARNKTVALLLCLFLGGMGIHRFYVGKIWTGIFYLFTGAFFGVGWIIDLIVILVGSFKDKSGMPLR